MSSGILCECGTGVVCWDWCCLKEVICWSVLQELKDSLELCLVFVCTLEVVFGVPSPLEVCHWSCEIFKPLVGLVSYVLGHCGWYSCEALVLCTLEVGVVFGAHIGVGLVSRK